MAENSKIEWTDSACSRIMRRAEQRVISAPSALTTKQPC